MIKLIKIGDLIYQNIKPYRIHQNGEKVWNIPNDVESLRRCVIDTLNWLTGQKIRELSGGDYTKLSAANSKAIALIVKAVDSLVDKSKLTEKEQQIWEKIVQLANSGYSDSDLLLNTITAIVQNIQECSAKIDEALKAESVEDLIKILEEL